TCICDPGDALPHPFSNRRSSYIFRQSLTPTDGPCFIDASQRLAQQLFLVMDKRITPGSLAVCLYDATNYPGLHFLALLKIDPSETFVQRIGQDSAGKRIVSLDLRDDVMPTTREKLHKAALLKPKDAQESYDLLLLDRQVAPAADFFARRFLGVELAMDAQKR